MADTTCAPAEFDPDPAADRTHLMVCVAGLPRESHGRFQLSRLEAP